MTVSKAQQASVNKYVKANYDRINVTLPKGRREVIKAHAEVCGESVNGFINRAIGEAMGERQQKPAEAAQGAGVILTPGTLKTAQEAAQRAGERVSEFIDRAVDMQAKRDKIMQGLKANHGQKEAGE